jgi:hypothetical protein
MSLHRRWSEWIGGQTDDTFDAFWEEYSLCGGTHL